ncbi:MarR family winged helix-turn-helix transcriptional regulator [Embleya sp. NBC_00896]|uniref:MarR family winged helix-turn-helix transcriptional regulator n=1 Tax=Embleya sp. NBC_00896 TaxID=2975961 RepID=UPI0038659EC0|nr:MarR family winged helix-turn-helix transcriptional regulator [Embleya sp. NBC_00896]
MERADTPSEAPVEEPIRQPIQQSTEESIEQPVEQPGGDCAEAEAATRGGPVSHALFRVSRLHRMYAGHLLRRTGLYPGQELLMMRLWEAGPQRQVDLVRTLDSDPATVTRMVQRLQKAGFVRRAACPYDRRVVVIEPTIASRALRHEVEEVWRQLEETTLGSMTAADEAAALRLLGAFEENLTAAASAGADDPAIPIEPPRTA